MVGLQGADGSVRLTAPSPSTPLRFGAFAPQGWKLEYSGWSATDAWAQTVHVAQLAEQIGYDHLWVYDHVETVPRREPTHVFEAFTTLAALSQRTETIRLGQLVTCAAYRNAGGRRMIGQIRHVAQEFRLVSYEQLFREDERFGRAGTRPLPPERERV